MLPSPHVFTSVLVALGICGVRSSTAPQKQAAKAQHRVQQAAHGSKKQGGSGTKSAGSCTTSAGNYWGTADNGYECPYWPRGKSAALNARHERAYLNPRCDYQRRFPPLATLRQRTIAQELRWKSSLAARFFALDALQSDAIPRRIIQSWKTATAPPEALANIREFNPGFEYVYYSDEAAGQLVNSSAEPRYRDKFNQLRGVRKWDFFRYLVVYMIGGFWFDTDVLFKRALDANVSKGVVLPVEYSQGVDAFLLRQDIYFQLGNFALGGRARHPFFRLLLDQIVEDRIPAACTPPSRAKGHAEGEVAQQARVYYETGPIALTQAYWDYTNGETDKRAMRDFTLLEQEKGKGLGGSGGFGRYARHESQGSWKPGNYMKSKLHEKDAHHLPRQRASALAKANATERRHRPIEDRKYNNNHAAR